MKSNRTPLSQDLNCKGCCVIHKNTLSSDNVKIIFCAFKDDLVSPWKFNSANLIYKIMMFLDFKKSSLTYFKQQNIL